MRNIRCILLFSVFFSFSGTLISQEAVAIFDRLYGLDQTLYNGKKYSYFLPPGTNGHQYLFSPDYVAGSVTIKGKCYQDITLNYDIFNQQLLLQYEDETGALSIIEMSKAWLESFTLGNMNFEFLNLEQNPRLFQVLGEGPVRILYYWRKNLNLDIAVGSSDFFFTNAVRDSYILLDEQLKPIRTKRSLIGLFDPGQRQEIKSYLRKNNSFKKKRLFHTESSGDMNWKLIRNDVSLKKR